MFLSVLPYSYLDVGEINRERFALCVLFFGQGKKLISQPYKKTGDSWLNFARVADFLGGWFLVRK